MIRQNDVRLCAIGLALCLLFVSTAEAARNQVEDVYNRTWCAANGGTAEVRNTDGTWTVSRHGPTYRFTRTVGYGKVHDKPQSNRADRCLLRECC